MVHVIVVKCLLEQQGSIHDVGKVFGAIVEVMKQLGPLLEAPIGHTKSEKDEQRKNFP